MAKKAITAKPEAEKEYLNDTNPSTITAKFYLQQLMMKDVQWRMKIKVGDILPRTYHKYTMAMVFDEAPHMRRIKALQEEISDIEDSAQQPLFQADTEEKIKDLEAEIEKEESTMEKYAEECPKIIMPSIVEELKYSGSDTLLVFLIPDSAINQLNENKLKFGMYKIELTPEI
jgi:hypothetical protein